MIPMYEVFGEPTIPAEARFWLPQLTFEDEGFGYFRDVWTIIEVTPSEAREVVDKEQMLIAVIDELSSNPDEFDRLAHFAESWDPDEPEDSNDLTPDQHRVMQASLAEIGRLPLEGLELGVAGLAYAMSSVGAVTAASCRGHPTPQTWSLAPVVYFAAEQHTATSLESLVKSVGCLFSVDGARAELLVIGGSSITVTSRLAQSIIAQL